MPEATLTQKAPEMTEEQIDKFLQKAAEGFAQQERSPVLHTPEEAGLEYEAVSFPSSDGTPLEAWFMPSKGSDKLIVANHPMGFSRSGLPAHLDPWKSLWASSGNDFEVNLIPDYKILHDAGYNVLTYDLRNFGHSSAANGGIGSSGIFESRDVLGSLEYVRNRKDTRDMKLGLFSRCLGCNSTFYAMKSHPEAFTDVRCLVGPEPVNTKTIVTQQLSLAGVPVDRIDDLDRLIVLKTSISFNQRDTREWAKYVCVPTLSYQVHDDVLNTPDDMQTMFDNIPVADKRFFWIEGTTRRWDGYLYFQRHPEQILDWFASHMS